MYLPRYGLGKLRFCFLFILCSELGLVCNEVTAYFISYQRILACNGSDRDVNQPIILEKMRF